MTTPRGSALSARSSSADGRSQEGRASGDAAVEAAQEAVAEATRASTPTGAPRFGFLISRPSLLSTEREAKEGKLV